MLHTPVVFIIYNRPDKTRQSFEPIRAAQPEVLFIIADGPKDEQDAFLVAETRQIVEHIDWKCKVTYIYSNVNLTCGYRISSGLDEVFRKCEKAIIIEDDIVVTPAFFTFCSSMLLRYENDPKVMAISGWNNLVEYKSAMYDAIKSKSLSIWGWATWRRAWNHYAFDPSWSVEEFNDRLRSYFSNPFWIKLYLHIYKHKLWHRYKTWDFQWTIAIYGNHGRVITSSVNLCRNIGFDQEGAHLTSFNLRALFPSFDIEIKENRVLDDEDEATKFDHQSLIFGIFSLYKDIRKLYLFYRNPQLIPKHQSQTGWDCTLQPFREPELCIEILIHLETFIAHPELTKYKNVFQRLIQ